MSISNFQPASLAREVRDKYVAKYYESGVIKKFNALKDEKEVRRVRYRDLPDTEVSGYPFATDRDENGELCFYFLPNSHEICVGTTGSGKTSGCVEPRIRGLATKKNKPCMFFTDPKGEVFERNAKYLQKQGYKIFLINFKDVAHSDCWNPLAEIYDSWMRQTRLNGKVEHHDSTDNILDYQMQDIREFFNSDGEFWSIGKMAFPSEEAALRRITFEKSVILSETEDLINQLVHILIPDTMLSRNDPSWMMGAQDILSGIIYAMLEDALDERSGFTRDNMNLMTIQEYFEIARDQVLSGGQMTPLIKTQKLSHKQPNDLSIRLMRTYFENAPTTTRSYLGCFRNAMQMWFNSKIFTICNGDTVNISDCEDTPFAIFMITRDYEKSDFTVAGLFIDWVYSQMMLKAENNGGTLEREMYFMLDEFGNIPAIRDFENKIATSRSRNIWFHMFVQSYAQIETVYDTDKRRSRIIRDNCNAHSFLGSQNYETKSNFSKECGHQTVLNPVSFSALDVKQIKEIPLLPISSLEELEPGQMYLRRTGLPLLQARFERSYMCKEFMEDNYVTPQEMCIESVPFNSEKYQYKYLSTQQSMNEFGRTKKCQDEEPVFVVPEFLKNIANK